MSDFSWKKTFKAELTRAGFDLDKLSEDNIALIFEPGQSPDTFYCDGILTSQQALANWVRKLTGAGFSNEDIKKAFKLNFER